MSQSGEPVSGGVENRKTVAVPGTPERVSNTDNPCSWVVLSAESDNAGVIAWGFSNAVRATPGGQVGGLLSAGQSVSVPVNMASLLWIDAAVAGDGVSFVIGG